MASWPVNLTSKTPFHAEDRLSGTSIDRSSREEAAVFSHDSYQEDETYDHRIPSHALPVPSRLILGYNLQDGEAGVGIVSSSQNPSRPFPQSRWPQEKNR